LNEIGGVCDVYLSRRKRVRKSSVDHVSMLKEISTDPMGNLLRSVELGHPHEHVLEVPDVPDPIDFGEVMGLVSVLLPFEELALPSPSFLIADALELSLEVLPVPGCSRRNDGESDQLNVLSISSSSGIAMLGTSSSG